MKYLSLDEVEKIDSPVELHEFALHYNWDDGIEIPRAIINNKHCDKGTALMIYWLAGPMYFCQYENRKEILRHYEAALYDLIKEIEEKYISGFYQNKKVLFNPRYDSKNAGYDHTQTYDDKPQKQEIPDKMFEPSIPDFEWEAMGKPIKPIKKVDYKKAFKSLYNEISKLEMDDK